MSRCVHEGLHHAAICFDRTHWHVQPFSQVYREGDVLKCRGCGWEDAEEIPSWWAQDEGYERLLHPPTEATMRYLTKGIR